MPRVVGMGPHPPVARPPEPRQRGEARPGRASSDAEVAFTDHRRPHLSGVQSDRRPPAVPLLDQGRRRQQGRPHARHRQLARPEPRRQSRRCHLPGGPLDSAGHGLPRLVQEHFNILPEKWLTFRQLGV